MDRIIIPANENLALRSAFMGVVLWLTLVGLQCVLEPNRGLLAREREQNMAADVATKVVPNRGILAREREQNMAADVEPNRDILAREREQNMAAEVATKVEPNRVAFAEADDFVDDFLLILEL